MKNDLALSLKIAKEVEKLGGTTYYVGGYVRDVLLGKDNKDIDIEVYGVTPNQLKTICAKFGHVDEVGVSFGVLKIHGYDIDITMPRKERATGTGHKDFAVSVDPFMDTKDAAKRRDFTINALMKNVLTGEITDHFGGMEDLASKTIRHIDDKTFTEDPLRVFRAAGFASRLEFDVCPETKSLCKTIEVSALSKERIFEETNKALLKSAEPSRYFKELAQMGHLKEFFPDIEALQGIKQDPLHHPEGDAFTHTMMVVDNAAVIRDDTTNPLAFMYSALYHDIGKAQTTVFEERKGRWTSIGHECAGEEMVEDAMRRITSDKGLVRYTKNMVKMHMQPHFATEKSKAKITNRMFDKSVCPEDLLKLSYCDIIGRKPIDLEVLGWWEGRLKTYYEVIKKPEVTGNDLIALGYKPGPEFSKILEKCHQIHLANVSKEDVIRHLPSILKGLGLEEYAPKCKHEELSER